jgi:hypothetical protein
MPPSAAIAGSDRVPRLDAGIGQERALAASLVSGCCGTGLGCAADERAIAASVRATAAQIRTGNTVPVARSPEMTTMPAAPSLTQTVTESTAERAGTQQPR